MARAAGRLTILMSVPLALAVARGHYATFGVALDGKKSYSRKVQHDMRF